MQVDEIINLLHKSVSKQNYDMVPTQKNKNSRRKFGLTLLDIEHFFMSIKISDLYKGPVLDRDVPGEEVFIFKKEIQKDVIFYLKIKKDNGVGFDRIKILSCHEDEN